jgi:hypothetical protein
MTGGSGPTTGGSGVAEESGATTTGRSRTLAASSVGCGSALGTIGDAVTGAGGVAGAEVAAAGVATGGFAAVGFAAGEFAAVGTAAAAVAFTAVDTGALTSGVLRGTTRVPAATRAAAAAGGVAPRCRRAAASALTRCSISAARSGARPAHSRRRLISRA